MTLYIFMSRKGRQQGTGAVYWYGWEHPDSQGWLGSCFIFMPPETLEVQVGSSVSLSGQIQSCIKGIAPSSISLTSNRQFHLSILHESPMALTEALWWGRLMYHLCPRCLPGLFEARQWPEKLWHTNLYSLGSRRDPNFKDLLSVPALHSPPLVPSHKWDERSEGYFLAFWMLSFNLSLSLIISFCGGWTSKPI